MNLFQLITFAWICAWVLCESLFPSMSYKEKIQASCIGAFAAAYSNNMNGIMWEKIKTMLK